jgi:hypothetical protein
MRLTDTTAELGRSDGRAAIVGEPAVQQKTAGFLYHPRGLRRYRQADALQIVDDVDYKYGRLES